MGGGSAIVGQLKVLLYVSLLPLLPVFYLVEYFLNEQRKEKKFIPFDFTDHGIPAFFCLLYLVLVFLPLMDIGEWGSAQSTVDFLTTILQFLLPLQIVAAITRNRSGIGAFTTFTSKMLRLYHHLTNGTETISDDTKYIFAVIGKAVKWEIRGDLNWEKLPPSIGKIHKSREKYDTVITMLNKIYTEIKGKGEDFGKAREGAAYKLLNDASAAYSDMKSLSEFKIPLLFISFFYICMTTYFTFLPYTFPEDETGVKVVKCIINLYVFLGMFNISVFISNPFRSSTVAVQTVSAIENKYRDNWVVNTSQLSYEPTSYVKLKI